MNRRTYLGVLAGTTAGMAGCLSAGSGVTGTSVEHVDPRREREQRPTIVSFDEAAGVVNVLGFMAYGSSSCNRVGIDSTTYDEDADTLRVVMTSKSKNSISMGCTADLASTWYRATIRIEDDLPQQVTVLQKYGDTTEKRTVDRSEQRKLCTSEHPPNSSAAKKAHWTCPERYVAVSTSG
jgi:hypothetical protein